MEEGTIRLNTNAAAESTPRSLPWVSASASNVGKVRKVNEDALLESPQIGLWAVADGVGGASAGDWASAFTVQALGRIAKPMTMSGFLAEVYDQLGAINGALRQQAEAGAHAAIATTIVALMFFEQNFACVWAGDSRLYLLRNGHFRQVNRDHSEVQEMVDQGILRPAEARHHPRGNVVTRAVGAYEKLELEMTQDIFCEGDVFLLCSDGLTKTMEDDEVAVVLDQPVDQAVQKLIQTALDRGAPDNVTVIAIKVLEAPAVA
jgi:serine/threonine protein phosphatase PrpC